MKKHEPLGQIIILNGAPRSGKTSIAHAIQTHWDGIWMNIGVDGHMRMLPERLRPGIGLRPGGERPDLEAHLPALYGAWFEAIAAHSRRGINVVADFGIHDGHAGSLHLMENGLKLLEGLPHLVVCVTCPLAEIMKRRAADSDPSHHYVKASADDPVPLPVARWQEYIRRAADYDLTLDTSVLTPLECAAIIEDRLQGVAITPTLGLAQTRAIGR